mmetsp:Transcript_20936/g.58802  ORF Transcript_20936/g.58802 Transcript_20936/m.58802 type:complete len:227 (-) Transcript_20936:1145-1825(-)
MHDPGQRRRCRRVGERRGRLGGQGCHCFSICEALRLPPISGQAQRGDRRRAQGDTAGAEAQCRLAARGGARGTAGPGRGGVRGARQGGRAGPLRPAQRRRAAEVQGRGDGRRAREVPLREGGRQRLVRVLAPEGHRGVHGRPRSHAGPRGRHAGLRRGDRAAPGRAPLEPLGRLRAPARLGAGARGREAGPGPAGPRGLDEGPHPARRGAPWHGAARGGLPALQKS